MTEIPGREDVINIAHAMIGVADAGLIFYSKGRGDARVREARDTAIVHLREYRGLSFPQIAAAMGAKSHSHVTARYHKLRPGVSGTARPWAHRMNQTRRAG